MNRAKWIACWFLATATLVAATASGQQEDLFGEGPAAAPPAAPAPAFVPQPAESPFAEKSVLTEIAADNATAANDFCKCVGEAESPVVARIEKALASPLRSSGLDYSDTPLEEVVNMIQDEYGIPVKIDFKALDEMGISGDEPININLNGISLRSALRLMLNQHQLTFIVRDEVLLITTPEEAEQDLAICVYDVRDIVGPAKDDTVDQLIDGIVACVATDSWAENGGGEAEIRWLKPGFLIVSQTRDIHDEVRRLLSTVRAVRKQSPGAANDADKTSAATGDANPVVTRSYVLSIDQSSNPEAVRQQVYDLITAALPDERWKGKLGDGQAVVLSVLPDRVILRHKSTVHEAVKTLLTDGGLTGNGRDARRGFGGGPRDGNFQVSPRIEATAGGGGGGFY